MIEQNKHIKTDWHSFSQLSIQEKCEVFQADERFNHVIMSQQFNRKNLERLAQLTNRIRQIAKHKYGANFLSTLLDHKRAMLYFVQPSSRTFMSFQNACQILGIKTSETRDVSTSSEIKGESQIDTVRTLASYVDLIIMRHPSEGFAEKVAYVLSNTDRPIPMINGGSGRDQHPTQALLDIYTLMRSFSKRGGIDGKKIAIVGDLARGRTARSLARLLIHFDHVELFFCSPPALAMGQDVKDDLTRAEVKFTEHDNLNDVLAEVDAVYMMRIQDEYDIGIDASTINYENFHIDESHVKIMKSDAIIMHPLPRRNEIAVAVDNDPRAIYWRQVRNGMWTRVALIASLFRVDQIIDDYYKSHYDSEDFD